MNKDRIDIAQLRDLLGWTQQQLADFCDTDRSTISKWEKEPPTKGPSLVLLKGLRDRLSPGLRGAKSADFVASAGREPAP